MEYPPGKRGFGGPRPKIWKVLLMLFQIILYYTQFNHLSLGKVIPTRQLIYNNKALTFILYFYFFPLRKKYVKMKVLDYTKT